MSDTNKPRISVITPSYNQGQFLEETIRSILSQNYPNLEFIIIDGGSTDNSVEIIRKYESDIAFWASEKDRGQAHAINKGLAMATGDIIGWLNSDDTYLPNTLDTIANLFEAREISWFAGSVENFREGNEAFEIIEQRTSKDRIDWLTHKTAIHQPGVFWRKEIMDQVGLLNEESHYTFDWEYWCRFILGGYFPLIDNTIVVARFRLHDESKTSSQWLNFLKEFIILADTLLKETSLTRSERCSLEKYKLDEQFKLLKKETYIDLVNYRLLASMKNCSNHVLRHPSYLVKSKNLPFLFDVFIKYPVGLTLKKLFR